MSELVLQPGETQLAEVRLHWSFIFGSFGRFLGALLTLGIAPMILLRSNTLTATNRRLIWRRGVFTRTVIEMELGRIAQVEVQAGLFARMFGLGVLKIIALDQVSFELSPLKHPSELKDLLMSAAAKARAGAGPAPTAGSKSEVLGAIERLGELRNRGVLSAEEFDKKKAELLSRI